MTNTPDATIRTPGYNDLYFRLAISFVASAIIVFFGDRDHFFQLLLLWEFYEALVASFIIALILVTAVNRITVRLDRKYDWMAWPIQRIGLQILLGFLLPAIGAFILAYIYFQLLGVHILDTVYLRYDYPVILILLVMLNLYYLAFYFYRQWKLASISQDSVASDRRELFVVYHGAKKIMLRHEEIAYFFHLDGYNFVRTKNNEDMVIPQTLDEVEALLGSKDFFRANRRMIVHYQTCKIYAAIEHGKLSLQVEPPFKEPVIISQVKAKGFKDWMAKE